MLITTQTKRIRNIKPIKLSTIRIEGIRRIFGLTGHLIIQNMMINMIGGQYVKALL